MPRFRCRTCAPLPVGLEYEDETGVGQCPRCNRNAVSHPYQIHPLVDVHFVVLDPKGPILGAAGQQRIVCEPKREHLSLHPSDAYAATDDPRVVTCPACKRTKCWQGVAKLFPELNGAPVRGGIQIDKDCC